MDVPITGTILIGCCIEFREQRTKNSRWDRKRIVSVHAPQYEIALFPLAKKLVPLRVISIPV